MAPRAPSSRPPTWRSRSRAAGTAWRWRCWRPNGPRPAAGRCSASQSTTGGRAEAAAEARQVGRWLAARGIPHRILRHDGPPPAAGIQQAARTIRLALLAAACRAAGILHLLLAHHRDDQAETVAIRSVQRPGRPRRHGPVPGNRWAAPAAAAPRDGADASRRHPGGARPAALDDIHPSNGDPRYQRVRLRRAGFDAESLLTVAADAARLC